MTYRRLRTFRCAKTKLQQIKSYADLFIIK